MLKALVITPNQRTKDMGDILQIARAEAKKREHTHRNVKIRAILYEPVTQVYVTVYEAADRKRGL